MDAGRRLGGPQPGLEPRGRGAAERFVADGPERHREREARLSAWLSADEGRTWSHRRAIEDTPGGSYSYPSVLQAADGLIHVSYSHVEPSPAGGTRREAIRHAVFDAAWAADAPRAAARYSPGLAWKARQRPRPGVPLTPSGGSPR